MLTFIDSNVELAKLRTMYMHANYPSAALWIVLFLPLSSKADGAIQEPVDLIGLPIYIAMMTWPVFVPLFILNLAVSIAIMRMAQKRQAAHIGSNAALSDVNRIPNLTKVAFVLTTLSFTFGPLSGIPGLLLAHLGKFRNQVAPGKGLLTASFLIGYLSVAQLILILIIAFMSV